MNKKHKIILIANTYNFFNSFMLNHIKELSKKYKIYLCCNSAYKLKKSIPDNVSLININYKRGLNFFHDIAIFFSTLFFLKKIKPYILISFTPKIGFMVAMASLIVRIPNYIHWFTGQIWVTKTGFSKNIFKFIDKIIFNLSDRVLVDSFSQRRFLIRENIITSQKSSVLFKGSVGGVNTLKFKFNKNRGKFLREKYSITKNTFIYLYLGRINKEKGISELVEAFEKINNKNVFLIIVGSLEDKSLKILFKKKNKILHINHTNNPEDFFSMANVLCLPSHREGFGTVVIEAASCSLPTLASKIYGLHDSITENKTGFFHKKNNVNDLRKKMLYLSKNRMLVKKIGKFARKKAVSDFENKLLTKSFIKYLNSNFNLNEK